jgi:hypothetical protein
LALRQILYFEDDNAPAQYRKDVRQWLKASRPGRWVGRPRAEYVDSWFAESNSDGVFNMDAAEKNILHIASQGYKGSRSRRSGIFDEDPCQRIRMSYGALQYAFKWFETASKI